MDFKTKYLTPDIKLSSYEDKQLKLKLHLTIICLFGSFREKQKDYPGRRTVYF